MNFLLLVALTLLFILWDTLSRLYNTDAGELAISIFGYTFSTSLALFVAATLVLVLVTLLPRFIWNWLEHRDRMRDQRLTLRAIRHIVTSEWHLLTHLKASWRNTGCLSARLIGLYFNGQNEEVAETLRLLAKKRPDLAAEATKLAALLKSYREDVGISQLSDRADSREVYTDKEGSTAIDEATRHLEANAGRSELAPLMKGAGDKGATPTR